MALPLSSQSRLDGLVQPPCPLIGQLLEEIHHLLDQRVVQEHQEASACLTRALDCFLVRNRMEPLTENDQRFYNLCQDLIDPQNNIRDRCLDRIRGTFEEPSAAQAVHEGLLFHGNKTYKITFAQPSFQQPQGWRLAVRGDFFDDRRDEGSTYAMVAQAPASGASWHIFSEDQGKTYKVALASDAFDQKGWLLGFFTDYSIDKRNECSFYGCIHKPGFKNRSWHFETNDGGRTYKILLATSDVAFRGWALAVHRSRKGDMRDATSSYAIVHKPGNNWEGHWKIEEE